MAPRAKREKPPAYQWYPKDFLSDGNVKGMTLEERGAYITLLSVCWLDETLPMDSGRLANMCGVPVKVFARLWPAVRACFTERDGRYVHQRLEKEREKQATHRQRQSDRGLKGADTRWRKHHASNGASIDARWPDDGSSVSDLQSPISVLRRCS